MGPVETEFMLGWMHARARVSIKLAIACVVLSACYRRLRWNCFPLNYIVYCLSPWIPFPVSRDASPSGSAARCYGATWSIRIKWSVWNTLSASKTSRTLNVHVSGTT